MYFQLQPPSHRRSSSGHYPLTPPTCAPASVNKCTSSVTKHDSKRDSASACAMLSKMATGRSSPTQRSPATSPQDYSTSDASGKGGGDWPPMEDSWSDKPGTHWQRQSSYVSFPDFEAYYQSYDRRTEVET